MKQLTDTEEGWANHKSTTMSRKYIAVQISFSK